jgi:4-amino-4-deoxy-L-arabinose transferase-like glycosyltransferase
MSEAVFLTRTAQWTRFWQEEPIGAIAAETGRAFVAHTGRPEIASHDAPAPTALLEDGVQLGLRNARHVEIREIGSGHYSFWHDKVYFAASDNSDPRTNGRRYTMSFPPVSRAFARSLYLLTVAMLVLVAAFTVLAIRNGVLGLLPLAASQVARRHAVTALGIASASTLVLVAVLRALPSTSPLVANLWLPILLLNGLSAWAFRTRYGPRLPRSVGAAFLVCLAVAFYFMASWAPQRLQGCHTNERYSVWEMFCVAPDSSSYYFKYVPGATRNPLYPWFIEAVTAGTGFSPQEYVLSTKAGAVHLSPQDPLMRVVRGQIVLMLLAALVLCAVLMWSLGTPFPAVAVLWMYDMHFLTSEELNIVLTEALVQTCLLLAVAALVAFSTKKRHSVLVLGGVACGLAYLTRQAAGYCTLLFGVMVLLGLWEDWRRWWRTTMLAVTAFVAICLVPQLHSYWLTGSFGSQDNIQYQYRIAHAMQYAVAEDVALMPDEETKVWLADAVKRRDQEHQLVREKYDDEYNRMIYYINANLYSVATPPGGYLGVQKSPEFFMKVATPILREHWRDYLAFSFRFWRFGMDRVGLGRLGVYGLSPWLTFAALWSLVLVMRDRRAIVGGALILSHWAAVAITCLFAVPIPRMVFASDGLVVIAAIILGWGAVERFGSTPAGAAVHEWLVTLIGVGPDDSAQSAAVKN